MLVRYNNFIKTVKDNRIEFILEEWNDNDGVFSTGKCHNRAVLRANGEWILKMDIDCYCDLEMFDKIFDLIDKYNFWAFYANFGCKGYLGDLGYPQGNQYLCHKELYFDIGGEPQLSGYGMEDYAFLYALAKRCVPRFKLDYNTADELHASIRDKIARPLNQKYKDIYFYHMSHKKSPFIKGYFHKNKKKLFQYCRELDNAY